MNLEPIRKALPSEPLLALSAGDATLACDATQLIFADALGVQRLTLREIRKVTHVEGHLVVTSSDHSIRGVLNVSSSDLKAFFADVQTLRKQRDAGLAQPLESRFKPAALEQSNATPLENAGAVPLEKPNVVPLEKPGVAPLEKPGVAPHPFPPQIPGFSVGLSAAPAEVIVPRVSPATVPAPPTKPILSATIQATPIQAAPIQTPVAPPIEDLLQYQPRAAKPNPRANLRSEREELPPPKPNPRAAVVQTPLAEPPSAPSTAARASAAPLDEPARPGTPAQPSTAPQQPRVEPRREPRAVPLEKLNAVPLEKTGSSPLEKQRNAAPNKPRTAALNKPRMTVPSVNLERFKPDLPALGQRLRKRFELQTPDLRFKLRRSAASAIDAVLSLMLMWGATRVIGGRELETLLRLPNDTRADLSMLESLKDLLPLFIAGALSGVLAALAAGLLYAVISALSPLRGTPGRHFLGLRLTLLSGARVSLAVITGRYLVNAMLLLVPSVLGLLPTLVALNGPAIALRSSLQLFGYTNLAGLAVLLIGQLPVYGPKRTQTLADYLTDCIVRDAPKAAPLEV